MSAAQILELLQLFEASGGVLEESDPRLEGKAAVVARALRLGHLEDGSAWAAHLAITSRGRTALATRRLD